MAGPAVQYDTPNIPHGDAVMTAHGRVHINAPASVVFRILRNTETWRDWNRFVPKVNITYQPPDEDLATAAEIQELVRNTSIAGTFDSDLTDGGPPNMRRRNPEEQPPPRFRLNSISSQTSGDSGTGQSARPGSRDFAASPVRNGSVASSPGGGKSAAQKFQDAQASRRASVAAGEEPAAISNNLSLPPFSIDSALSPGRTSEDSRTPSVGGVKGKNNRRKSSNVEKAAQKASQATLTLMYGEPSVRVQLKTRMTFFCRMRADAPNEFQQTNLVVTEVMRPDDAIEGQLTPLTRSKTHTLSRSGAYRIVWALDHDGASAMNLQGIFSGKKLPKYLLSAERVQEIEPTVNGDGSEACVYRTWENQKGPMAKIVKRQYGDHIQRMFEVWGEGLKEFCEGLNPAGVARRDFSIDL